MTDSAAKDLCWILTNSSDEDRLSDATAALLGIAPSLAREEVPLVLKEMAWILTNSSNRSQRAAATQVLVAVKSLHGR